MKTRDELIKKRLNALLLSIIKKASSAPTISPLKRGGDKNDNMGKFLIFTLLKSRIKIRANRVATGPKIRSIAPSPINKFDIKQPTVSAGIAIGVISAKMHNISLTLNCKKLFAEPGKSRCCVTVKVTYNPPNRAARVRFFVLLFNLITSVVLF